MHQIQSIVMPNLSFGAPEVMYARLSTKAYSSNNDRKIHFSKYASATFDTYFNALTIDTWKKHCNINDLNLSLTGKGQFIIKFGLHKLGQAQRWLSEEFITLQEDSPTTISIPFWDALNKGLLYFSLQALEDDVQLHGGYYATTTPAVNNIKLGIVITHFNRKQYVIPAINRIKSELLNDPLFKDKIELVVVDNSQNITTEEAEGITLIPNKNLGGSGGFTRGLLHLEASNKNFSHCLFMDDDASCEIESIKRTYHFLSLSHTPKLAFAGALLRELEPFRLFEKGAKFDGMVRPLKSGLDMREELDLMLAEVNDQKPNYGAWWFFAFNLKDFNRYAFPFFVRGDDIRFGIDNQFNIITLNGVACWGDDFALKSGPLPLYLDVRYHLLSLLTIINRGFIYTALKMSGFVLKQVFSYNYASARACILAIKHVIQGPTFFKENIDTSTIRQAIGALSPSEKMLPIDRQDYNVVYSSPTESHLESGARKIVRLLTLNGFLLPSIFIKKQAVFQHKNFRAPLREVYRFNAIYYEHEPSMTGYVVYHNKKAFFSILLSFFAVLFILLFKYKTLAKSYNNSWQSMTSKEFWQDIYQDTID